MSINGDQLGQLRPLSTGPESIYSTPANKRSDVKVLNLCNVTDADSKFSIYHDKDGTTYGLDTALFYQQTIPAKTTISIGLEGEGWAMSSSAGNIAVQSSVAGAINFTLYGSVIDL